MLQLIHDPLAILLRELLRRGLCGACGILRRSNQTTSDQRRYGNRPLHGALGVFEHDASLSVVREI